MRKGLIFKAASSLMLIGAVGVVSVSGANASDAVERAKSAMDTFNSQVSERSSQGETLNGGESMAGQIGHSGGVPSGFGNAQSRGDVLEAVLEMNKYTKTREHYSGYPGYPSCRAGYEVVDRKRGQTTRRRCYSAGARNICYRVPDDYYSRTTCRPVSAAVVIRDN